jgi:hypothetical protein
VPTYPYTSGQTALVQAFSQLRNGFPSKVDAGYLKRFNIAPSNESYIISILRFLGLLDDEGNRVEDKTGYFFGSDDAFESGLEETIRGAYSQVFDEMGDRALESTKDTLVHWFRASDKTSNLVGQRQASTFQTLAALAGHGEVPSVRPSTTKKTSVAAPKPTPKKATAKASTQEDATPKVPIEKLSGDDNGGGSKNAQDVGLTVRIEVNLPPGGDADTYDAIFASIKKHLMS